MAGPVERQSPRPWIRRPAQLQLSASRCRISAQVGRRSRPASSWPVTWRPHCRRAGRLVRGLADRLTLLATPPVSGRCRVRPALGRRRRCRDVLGAIADLERVPGDGCLRPESASSGRISGMPPARCPGLACSVASIPVTRSFNASPFSESAMAGRPARDHLLPPTAVRVLAPSLRPRPGLRHLERCPGIAAH